MDTPDYFMTTLATNSSNSTVVDDKIHVASLVVICVLYVLMLLVGVITSVVSKAWKDNSTESLLLAGRNVGLLAGVLTLTATYVGGGYTNGTAESVYKQGLVWCLPPIFISLSAVVAGLLFAGKMREQGYVTMLDPFNKHYGRVTTAILCLPASVADLFFTAAILAALGATITVITSLDNTTAILISAAVALVYTVMGGLYSVIVTDIIQLFCIVIGLWIPIPWIVDHEAVTNIWDTAEGKNGWLGTVDNGPIIALYIDLILSLLFGGSITQIYFQRILSQKTVANAKLASYLTAVFAIICSFPAMIVGAVAKSTDWSQTSYPGGVFPGTGEDYTLTLPVVLQYLTPTAVAVVGLSAVTAAVMSSSDSTMLSASGLISRHIYLPIRDALATACNKKPASDSEVMWVMRVVVVLVAVASTAIAIEVQSVLAFFYLISDLLYAIVFPQLFCVVHLHKICNVYGALLAVVVTTFFRFSAGIPDLDIDAVIHYEWYFPIRTVCMVICFILILGGSVIASLLFKKSVLPMKADILGAFHKKFDDTPEKVSNGIPNGTENPTFVQDDEITTRI